VRGAHSERGGIFLAAEESPLPRRPGIVERKVDSSPLPPASEDPPISELIQKTEGMQPWRRVFHAFNGTILVLALLLLPIPDSVVFSALGALLAALAFLDVVRLTRPAVNRVFFKAFGLLASPREAKKVASSTWYLVGVLLALLLFPRTAALAGILTMALGDPAAAVVGGRFGRRKLGKGTLEGSITFALVAFGVQSLFVPWPVAATAALATAAVEALPWPVDDNLSLPLVASGVVTLLL
jgi:dolichol kinase